MLVHVRLLVSQPYAALLVIDRAVWSDQGQKFVYVIGKDNKVQARPVTPGPLQEDGLRAIVEGLKKDDWVVIGGLQLVKPGIQVQPEKVNMPVLKAP
jgi:multidrug efflux pump subunit AcrA (membrane-fusion protein)